MDYPISSRAASLAPSLTLAISAKAKELRAAGEDVIGFGAGETDFDTPQHINDAAAQALADGFTKYTPSSGIPELRQAVADKFQKDYGVEYEPSQVIVNCGGKHSCFNVIYATCEAGDEVIIPAPYWLSYPEMAKLAGAKPPADRTLDGKDIAPLLLAKPGAATPHKAFYFYARGQLHAVRSGNWKLFFTRGKQKPKGIPSALYNLASDIGETTNVLGDHPGVAKRWAKRVAGEGATASTELVQSIYSILYSRKPTAAELNMALGFLQLPAESRLTRWEQYSHALLAANEMSYID